MVRSLSLPRRFLTRSLTRVKTRRTLTPSFVPDHDRYLSQKLGGASRGSLLTLKVTLSLTLTLLTLTVTPLTLLTPLSPLCSIAVMHAYVDHFDFTDLALDDAIRRLLGGFRLPGEAQKIDRIMEKFAQRYCCCNPSVFRAADVAYVLAFSVIMLNTDAHNPGVKNKMSRDGFIRNNRGIDNGEDLDPELLKGIYDRITTHEIKMKDDEVFTQGVKSGPRAGDSSGGGGGGGSDRALDRGRSSAHPASGTLVDAISGLAGGGRYGYGYGRHNIYGVAREADDDEMARLHAHLQEQARSSIFLEVHDQDAVRPMVSATWPLLLQGFGSIFTLRRTLQIIDLTLTGLRLLTMLGSLLGLSSLRLACVRRLAHATSLSNPGLIQIKCMAAMRALLRVAEENGTFFDEACWVEIIACLSRLDLLHQIAAGMATDELFFRDSGKGEGAPRMTQPGVGRHAAVTTKTANGGSKSIQKGMGGMNAVRSTSRRSSLLESYASGTSRAAGLQHHPERRRARRGTLGPGGSLYGGGTSRRSSVMGSLAGDLDDHVLGPHTSTHGVLLSRSSPDKHADPHARTSTSIEPHTTSSSRGDHRLTERNSSDGPRSATPTASAAATPGTPATPAFKDDSVTPAQQQYFTIPNRKQLAASGVVAVLQMIDPMDLSRLYLSTENFDSDSVIAFVKALCWVARQELYDPNTPR